MLEHDGVSQFSKKRVRMLEMQKNLPNQGICRTNKRSPGRTKRQSLVWKQLFRSKEEEMEKTLIRYAIRLEDELYVRTEPI